MSFTDEYLKLKKKREEEEAEKLKAQVSGNSFSNEYSGLRAARIVNEEEDDDIAPVVTTSKKDEDEEERTWFKAGALDDGLSLLNIGKTILGTVGDAAVGLAKGIGYMGEGVGDLISYGGAAVADSLGFDDAADDIRKRATTSVTDMLFGGLEEKTDKYSVLGDKSDSVTQGLGQVATILATGGLAGYAGMGALGATAMTTGLMGASSMGSGMGEAYLSGATDEEAATYGLIKGAVDAGSELLFGGLGKAVGAVGLSKGLTSVDDMIAKKLSEKITNHIAKNFVQYGVKASAEGLEEVIAGVGSAMAKQATYMSDKELGELLEDENLMEQFVVGAVTSGIAQSGLVPGMKSGSLAEANKTGRDFITGLSTNEQKVIDKVVEDRIAEEESDGKKLTNKEKDKIYDAVVSDMDKGYISTDTIEEVLGGETYKAYKDTIDSEDALRQEFDTLNKMKQGEMTGEQIDRRAELKAQLEEIKTADKRTQMKSKLGEEVFGLVQNDRLMESYNERGRRSQAFEADLTQYDAKQQETVKKAVESGILNNTRRTHEFVDMIAKISADKGVLFDFTNNEKLKGSVFAVDGKQVNGFVTKDGVTLNIDSAKSLNSVVGHEITHVLEGTELYDALQQTIVEYAKAKGDYQGRYDSLAKLYEGVKDANVDAELTADLVGDYLFTDPDFIHSLSTSNRNVFQKVYDEIKYLAKVATAGSKEARELEKVKRAFEKAYKTEGKTVSGTKHSYSGVNPNENGYQIADAEQMEAEGKSSEEIRQETGWFRSYDNRWRYEIDDSKAVWHLDTAEPDRHRLFYSGEKSYKLKDLLDHEELYKAYPQLKDVTVYVNPNTEFGGYVVGRNTSHIAMHDVADNSTTKWTIIHELQHIIQNIEGFASGASKYEYSYLEWGEKEYEALEKRKEIAKKLYAILRRHGESISKDAIWYNQTSVNVSDEIIEDNYFKLQSLGWNNKRTQDLIDAYYEQVQILNRTTPEGQYYATAGEIEAYDTQARIRMTAEERNAMRPNIDRTDAIVKYSLSDSDGKPIDSERISADEFDTKYSLASEFAAGEGGVKYWRPKIGKQEWELIDYRKNREFDDPAFDIDEDEKWLYANQKGVTVFAIYSKNDPDDPTVLYAAKGKNAEKKYAKLQKYMEGKKNANSQSGSNPDRANADRWAATVPLEGRTATANLYDDGHRRADAENVPVYGEESERNSGTVDVQSGADYRRSEVTEHPIRASEESDASSLPSYSLSESASYAEIAQEQYKLGQRERDLNERKREANSNPELLQAMDEYSNLFSELRSLLPKKRTGTATQAELDRIEEIVALRDKRMNRIKELQESLGLNAIAEEEREIRETIGALRVAADAAWEREGAEKENKAIEKSGLSAPEYFRKKALKAFKTTANFNEAGYMLPDGKLLNFSGGERNHRYRDHREIGEIYEATQGTAALNRFLNDGNIRIMAESPGIDIPAGVEPTQEQYVALRRFIKSHGASEGQFFVDISGTDGRSVGKYSYEGRVNADRVLNDIKYFYQSGEVREQSSIGQFLSLSNKDEAPVRRTSFDTFGEDIKLATVAENATVSETESVAPAVEEVGVSKTETATEKKPNATLYNKRDGKNGWGKVYGTAQEALNDAVQSVNPTLWDAFNDEFDNAPRNTPMRRGSIPITDALVAVQEDVRQEAITPIQGAQLLSEVYANGGADALRSLYNPNNGNLYTEHLERAKLYETVAPVSGEVSPVFNDTISSQQVAGQQEIPRSRTREHIGADAPDVQAAENARTEQMAFFEEPEVPKAITRKELHANIVDGIKSTFKTKGFDFDKVLKDAKNLSTFATVDNTPQRVMEKALGYKEGQILSDITVNKVAQNETEGIKWLNNQIDTIKQISKQYGIKPGSKESAAAQMFAEGFYVDENNDIIAYGDAELAKDFPNANVRQNIKLLASDPRIRQIYDETLGAINESRTRNAYPEIPRLDNYFLHFRAMEDTFSKMGLPFNPNDIRAKDLPTDLNGVTADLKPGQPYFASAMHRTGKRTSFDLLGGMERYLSSAKNQIYHIDDIQNLRALRNYIADTYGQGHGLDGLDTMSEEEAQERIKEVYGAHLSTFAKYLNEEANILAGKTALIDRGLEGIIGRRGITFLNTVNGQVGKNMVGFNISSSLTNFLPVAQTFAKTNKADFVKAFGQTVAHKISGRNDGFAENSPVMIRRKGADRFNRTPWEKVSDTGYVFMSAVDDISTELIARTKYNELVRKGMDEQKAHCETDKWVSRMMGDRSLGQQPQLYNSKMLGLITKFQLEVRNQLDSQFYDTIQEAKVSNEHIQNELAKNAKTAAKVASTFVQLAVVQHLFGKAFESVAGYNPAFDIIEVLMTAFGFDDDEESEDTALDNIEQGFLALLEDLPYTSTFTGGRIPISTALPVEELVTGKDEWGNEKSRWETLGEVAPYYLLPGGYGQIKKTTQGLGMFSDEHPIAGSYTDSGNLRFPVDDTIGNRIQAGIFGQYASENARDYFDNERSPLKEKQIQEFIDVDVPIREYWDYREGLNKQDTLEDKSDYIAGLDLPVEKKNILINNIVDRKNDVDMTGYEDFSSFEEFDFYSKNPEKYEFLQSNGVSYQSYTASEDAKEKYDGIYSWYRNYPDKVTVSKAVTDNVVEYREYTSALNAIRADKDANGNSISGSAKEKKAAYINGLDLDYGAKLILFKSEYNADDTYNYDIIDYLNGREDISYEEMVTILKELGFEVSGNNISW